jgi:hypothetical protein
VITNINIQPGVGFRQYFFEQPVSETHTRIFFLNMRNFMPEAENDGPIHARNKAIAKQDIDILQDIYPRMTPLSNTKEVLVPADKAIVAYRDWLARFDEKGWRIDLDELNRRNDKATAFAIPSPARREAGNWVVEPVPLLGSREARKQSQDEAA